MQVAEGLMQIAEGLMQIAEYRLLKIKRVFGVLYTNVPAWSPMTHHRQALFPKAVGPTSS
jgi:hypothetical protein